MTPEQITTIVVSAFLSGILGVGISAYFYHRLEKRKLKIDVLRKIVGYRYVLQRNEHFSEPEETGFYGAMNEAFIIFYDAPRVMEILDKMHQELGQEGRTVENLITLIKAMCKSLSIANDQLNDSFIAKPFSPPPKPIKFSEYRQ